MFSREEVYVAETLLPVTALFFVANFVSVIAAHGNSLRGLVYHLDKMTPEGNVLGSTRLVGWAELKFTFCGNRSNFFWFLFCVTKGEGGF